MKPSRKPIESWLLSGILIEIKDQRKKRLKLTKFSKISIRLTQCCQIPKRKDSMT